MHGGKHRWCVCWLAVAMAAAASTVLGDDGTESGLRLPSTGQAPDSRTFDAQQSIPSGQLATFESNAFDPQAGSGDDLARRVADLEKRLAQATAADSAAKEKAAGRPLIAPSGRIQFDVANFSQNAASVAEIGEAKNTVGFRRARIALLGSAFDVCDYIIEMDFANRGVNSVVNAKDQSTGFKDVYMQVRELPLVGNVRVGHFKECFGMEQLHSDNYLTFMERWVGDEGAFVPGRNDGIMAFNWTENERATWAIGAFTNQTGFDQPPTFVYDHWGLDFTTRATYLPWYDEPSGGRGVLHTGLAYSYRSAPDHTMSFSARPESGFAPAVVNFTLTNLQDAQVVGAEAAFAYGPLSFQSEVFGMSANRINGTTNTFYGTYAYVSYFLTGENRPYNRKLGVFDRVRPYENFFRVRTGDGDVATGCGAWEVAYRFSYIDMMDNMTIKGAGIATDHTLGLNWYLNPFSRIAWNYVHSQDVYNPAANTRVTGGALDIFEMRFAMDF